MPLGMGHWGTGGGEGVKNLFFPKFNQIWYVITHMNGMFNATIFWVPAPWGPGEGPKDGISLNFNCEVNSKDF